MNQGGDSQHRRDRGRESITDELRVCDLRCIFGNELVPILRKPYLDAGRPTMITAANLRYASIDGRNARDDYVDVLLSPILAS